MSDSIAHHLSSGADRTFPSDLREPFLRFEATLIVVLGLQSSLVEAVTIVVPEANLVFVIGSSSNA